MIKQTRALYLIRQSLLIQKRRTGTDNQTQGSGSMTLQALHPGTVELGWWRFPAPRGIAMNGEH